MSSSKQYMYLFHTNYGTKILQCTDHIHICIHKAKTLMGTTSEGQNQLRRTLKYFHFFDMSKQGWCFVYHSKLQLAT